MTNLQPRFLDTPQGRRIAYHRTDGTGPGIVFLGGFMSDMQGTKAVHLENWAVARGRAFLRLDYSGHGASSGEFEEGCISDWQDDALAVIEACTTGRQILVGSSMGGWIALLIARMAPELINGLVTIAAAPDFTEDSMWAGLNDIERAKLMREGRIFLPSDYGKPYPVTRRLIEDGRQNLVLREPLDLLFPARFLQGTADRDVEQSVALALLKQAEGHDIRLTFVSGADHSFSTPDCLSLIGSALDEVTACAET